MWFWKVSYPKVWSDIIFPLVNGILLAAGSFSVSCTQRFKYGRFPNDWWFIKPVFWFIIQSASLKWFDNTWLRAFLNTTSNWLSSGWKACDSLIFALYNLSALFRLVPVAARYLLNRTLDKYLFLKSDFIWITEYLFLYLYYTDLVKPLSFVET